MDLTLGRSMQRMVVVLKWWLAYALSTIEARVEAVK